MKLSCSTSRICAVLLVLAMSVLTIASGNAQGTSAPGGNKYPTRPIRLVVTAPAGGGLDVVARLVGQTLAERLGQPIIVDNRPGASGIIGVEAVAKAPADGYTLLFDSLTSQAINPHLYPTIPYNTERDLVQIGLVAVQPYILVGNASLPADIRQLVAMAKEKPTYVTVASFGVGSASHLAAEMFQQKAGVKFVHVPYKGGPPAITDVASGQVMVLFSSLAPALPLIKSGKLRAYGMATSQRATELPELPTIQELLGYDGFNVATELGFMAPAGTPPDIVSYLHEELLAVMAQPHFKEQLEKLGFIESKTRTLDETAAHYRAEFRRWQKVIKDANVKPE